MQRPVRKTGESRTSLAAKPLWLSEEDVDLDPRLSSTPKYIIFPSRQQEIFKVAICDQGLGQPQRCILEPKDAC
jgi:hypothetical protein